MTILSFITIALALFGGIYGLIFDPRNPKYGRGFSIFISLFLIFYAITLIVGRV